MESTSTTPKPATTKPRTPTPRQTSNLSTKSQSSVGSPRVNRKPISTAKAPTPKSSLNDVRKPNPNQLDTAQKVSSRKSSAASTVSRSEKAPKSSTPTPSRKLSADSTQSRTLDDTGNRRAPEKRANGLTSKTTPSNTTKTTKPTGDPARRSTVRDINKNSQRDRPIRSDSSDIEAASKLVSSKICELHSQLSNNNLITGRISAFIDGCVDTLVVLPLGRFSQNSQSLWKAAMMELLIQIATPKTRIFLDPSLTDLEKESLRIHSFHHIGDKVDGVVITDSVRASGPTLYYIPDGDLETIERVIEGNRGNLHQIRIIGRSLQKLAETADPYSTLKQKSARIVEERFPFDLNPQTAFSSVFSDLCGHRFLPRQELQQTRASSLDIEDKAESPVLKSAVSAPSLSSPEGRRVSTTLLTIGAICCGAGLAWMFINKR